MSVMAKIQKLGSASRRHHKQLSATQLERVAKAHAIQAHTLELNRTWVARAATDREIPLPLSDKGVLKAAASKPVEEPVATQVAGKSEAQLNAERLAMHRKAVSMIAGMWKDRGGCPPDGVEYQNQMREVG